MMECILLFPKNAFLQFLKTLKNYYYENDKNCQSRDDVNVGSFVPDAVLYRMHEN